MQGRLLFWDCDVAAAVQAVQSPQRMKMACVAVSPSGGFLAVAGDHLICVFDLQVGGGGGVLAVAGVKKLVTCCTSHALLSAS
jgi:hypothetical protein